MNEWTKLPKGLTSIFSVWNHSLFLSLTWASSLFESTTLLNRGGCPLHVPTWLSFFFESLVLSLSLESPGTVKVSQPLFAASSHRDPPLLNWAPQSHTWLPNADPQWSKGASLSWWDGSTWGHKFPSGLHIALGFWEAVNESLMSLAVGGSDERVWLRGSSPFCLFVSEHGNRRRETE